VLRLVVLAFDRNDPRRHELDRAGAGVRYPQKVADGAGLTANQRYALRPQARAEATAREHSAVSYYDVTLSVDKSRKHRYGDSPSRGQQELSSRACGHQP
jgi:hypothetical protein